MNIVVSEDGQAAYSLAITVCIDAITDVQRINLGLIGNH